MICGLEGAAPGHPIGLHGHGLRARLQLGPPGPSGAPEETLVLTRRFECQRCGAVIVVAPRDVLSYLRYRARAVAMALALLAEGHASPAIRARVSPQQILGHDGRRGWRAVFRWARRASQLWPVIRAGPSDDARALATTAVRALASRAPAPTGRLLEDAMAGVG